MRKLFLTVLILGALAFGAFELSKSRSFQLFGTLITHIEVSEPLVALTFDDGPTPRYTSDILALLEAEDIQATFFLVGEAMENAAEATAAIAAAGHEIGNHSYSHSRMVLMGAETVREELRRTDALIRGSGYDGPILFRPPYGKRLVILPWVLRQMDRATVLWSLEPETDLGPDASPQDIAAHVVDGVEPGSIVLLHVMFSTNEAARAALPLIIDGLRARGFGFATVSDLLARAGP